MQKLKSFFLSLFTFIGFCILGLTVGVGGGFGFLILDAQGAFSLWMPLNGEHQFEKIGIYLA